METIKVIAEIGCNHKGDMEIAREMITVASIFCKVDMLKFQKRTPKELLTTEEYHAPHPNPANAYGATYGEHREYLELDLDQHRQLKKWCEEMHLEYSASVWDLQSARDIASLQPLTIKVPSACNLNKPLLEFLCEEFPGEIHISVGMTTQEEEESIVGYFESRKRGNDIVLYSCTSGYPVQFDDVTLLEISRLRNNFGNRVKGIGFSGHHLGIAVDIAAVTLGARWIERHFTLDRTWKGTDHAASLEPDGMRRLARDVRAVVRALDYKKKSVLDVEQVQRDKLKKNQIKWSN